MNLIRSTLGKVTKVARYYGDLRLSMNPLVPPPNLIRVSSISQYLHTGQDWADRLVRIGGLEPSDVVLEVGCGNGRVALHLVDFLRADYHGFDIRQDEIIWLRNHFSARNPNFHFHHSDVRNRFYNPDGRIKPSAYRFPFEDGSFDFVYLTSIFTHLMPSDLKQYLSEAHRVLRPGGTLFASYFLLNNRTQQLLDEGMSARPFEFHCAPHCRTDNPDTPEDAVAYDEEWLLSLYENLFAVRRKHYGTWRSTKILNAPVDYQDIIVANKAH